MYKATFILLSKDERYYDYFTYQRIERREYYGKTEEEALRNLLSNEPRRSSARVFVEKVEDNKE